VYGIICRDLFSAFGKNMHTSEDIMHRFVISNSLRAAMSALLLAVLASPSVFAQHFTRTDLTRNMAGETQVDPNLVNAWGLSRSSTSPWWVSDNGTGLSTLYDGAGAPQKLVVTIPLPDGKSGTSAPTGTVFNYTTGFEVVPKKPAVFLFVTEDGTISGWNPKVKQNAAIVKVNRSDKAIYKGCAIAQTKIGAFLYATNFSKKRVEVFDSSFQRVHLPSWAFRDPRIPDSYAPFNIQNVGGNLVVTFAKTQEGSKDEVHGPGLGFVAIFSAGGRLRQSLEHGDFLNAPWGVALAPSDFSVFGHRILIGNFGDGRIHAFNAITGRFEGTLLDPNEHELAIDGLWALSFGNNAGAGSALELYFTAGPDEEKNGLLGKIVPVTDESRGNTE
jgi:uncharacterized protein (TIGR03118 family)